jgi:hypothetical protein
MVKLKLQSNLGMNEIFKNLKSNIGEKKWFSNPKDKYFVGMCSITQFKINRSIQYRNSFLPMIEGRIIRGNDITKIDVSMSFHPLVLIFGFVWFSGIGLRCFLAILILLDVIKEGQNKQLLFVPFLLLGGGIALFSIPFKIEVKKAKDKLMDILKAEEI